MLATHKALIGANDDGVYGVRYDANDDSINNPQSTTISNAALTAHLTAMRNEELLNDNNMNINNEEITATAPVPPIPTHPSLLPNFQGTHASNNNLNENINNPMIRTTLKSQQQSYTNKKI